MTLYAASPAAEPGGAATVHIGGDGAVDTAVEAHRYERAALVWDLHGLLGAICKRGAGWRAQLDSKNLRLVTDDT